MREDAAQRAMQAYDLMVRTGLAARPATTMSGTTVPTSKEMDARHWCELLLST